MNWIIPSYLNCTQNYHRYKFKFSISLKLTQCSYHNTIVHDPYKSLTKQNFLFFVVIFKTFMFSIMHVHKASVLWKETLHDEWNEKPSYTLNIDASHILYVNDGSVTSGQFWTPHHNYYHLSAVSVHLLVSTSPLYLLHLALILNWKRQYKTSTFIIYLVNFL